MGTLFSGSYLQFGTKVRRRQLPGEPGDRTVGRVMGGTLDGRQHFVMFGSGARQKMELLPTSEIETVSGGKAS
jgi:hypothetical protein